MSTLRDLARTVDERLADLYDAELDLRRRVDDAATAVRLAAGQRRTGARRDQWDGTLEDALAVLRQRTPQPRQLAAYEHAHALLTHVRVEQADGEAVWDEYRWHRAFLVANDNGHVHRDMTCPTCRPSTRYEWLPALSGASEDEIVAAAGAVACTVCYPSAPADILNREPTFASRTREAKRAAAEERALAKADRDAAARAKAPTKSGEPLEVPASEWSQRPDRLRTERAAIMTWLAIATMTHPSEAQRRTLDLICAALADKHGRTVEAQRAELERKADAKRKRDSR